MEINGLRFKLGAECTILNNECKEQNAMRYFSTTYNL